MPQGSMGHLDGDSLETDLGAFTNGALLVLVVVDSVSGCDDESASALSAELVPNTTTRMPSDGNSAFIGAHQLV